MNKNEKFINFLVAQFYSNYYSFDHKIEEDEIKFILSFLNDESGTKLKNSVLKSIKSFDINSYNKTSKILKKLSEETIFQDKVNIDFFIELNKEKALKRIFFAQVKKCLSCFLRMNTKELTLTKKLDNLAKIFSLNQAEQAVVKFFLVSELVSSFSESIRGKKEFKKDTKDMALILGVKNRDLREIINKSSGLNLIVDNSGDESWHHSQYTTLDNHVLDYLLSEKTKENVFLDRFYNSYEGDTISLNNFFLTKDEKKTLIYLIQQKRTGINILLHGEPGTGKTELAKALGKETKKNVFFLALDNGDGGQRQAINRINSLKVTLSVLDLEKSIIIVDEADTILNNLFSFIRTGTNSDKSRINFILETHKAKIIWITNETHFIESSILRRFNYNLSFEKMTQKQRYQIFEYIINKNGFSEHLKENDIKILSQYQVPASAISMALDSVKSKATPFDSKRSLKQIETILEKQEELLAGKTFAQRRSNFNDNHYNVNGLNLNISPSSLISDVSKFYDLPKRNNTIVKNYNLLFHGPPGTGKTEFVKYLASSLKRDLIVKKGSDLISPYVGETAQNISHAFRESARNEAILFFDEADTFFISRENDRRPWEISQTNELLCQMENFPGVFICSTNFINLLDQASHRRFAQIVKFDYLTDEGKLEQFKQTLSNLKINLGNNTDASKRSFIKKEIIEKLYSLKRLTPGDFKIAFQQCYLLNHALITPDLIIDKLITISKTKHESKIVGF